MKSIIFRGPFLTYSGYGTHSRQICRWLLDRQTENVFFQVLPWGITPWAINENHFDGLAGKIMSRTGLPSKPCDVSIQVQLPNEWDTSLARFNVGVTALVETDICHPDWIKCINNMDLVIVPSYHTKETIENTGNVTTKLVVIPESYLPSMVNGHNDFDLKLDTKFNFMMFGQLTGNNAFNDRKNTFFTIKWLCETFKKDPDVGIILKTNSGKNTHIDYGNTVNTVAQLIKEVRKSEFPKIHLIHGNLSDSQICSLYKNKSVKALVALTRGEGFGLPILDAAVAGLPVIATDWSGHLDFMNRGRFIKVNYKLNKIHESRVDNKIFMENAKWADPNENDAKKKFKKFRQASAIPTQWANELSEELINEFSYERISLLYDDILGQFI
jgi:glycosyltransferase involved in cell wall biosynthesis